MTGKHIRSAPADLTLNGKAALATGASRGIGLRAPESMGIATGRMIEPGEVANRIAYLLSPLAASTTGADYLIDGGVIRTP